MIAQKNAPGSPHLTKLVDNTAIAGAKDHAGDCLNLDVTITSLLQLMHIPAHINGYHYLRKAILLEVESQEISTSSAKVLFSKVAKYYGVTPDKIDRGIRYALSIAWNQCDFSLLRKAYSFTTRFAQNKPTNLEFIACASDYYKLKLASQYRITLRAPEAMVSV